MPGEEWPRGARCPEPLRCIMGVGDMSQGAIVGCRLPGDTTFPEEHASCAAGKSCHPAAQQVAH